MNRTQSPDQPPAQTVVLPPHTGDQFTIIGGSVRVLLDGPTSGGRCCIFECPIPPGDGPPLHWHKHEDELFYVVAGRFKFSVDGKEFYGEAGTFACAPRGSVHAFRNVGKTTGTLLLTCTPSGLEIPFRAVRDPKPGENREALTPDQVVAEFSKHGITFVGPPLTD